MSKHKSEDYKITSVKYYLENDTNYTKTCDIFLKRYDELEEIKRLDRKSPKNKLNMLYKN